MTLTGLLKVMMEEARQLDKPYADEAYDLALTKFSQLSNSEEKSKRQIDCRHYFRAYCNYVQESAPKGLNALEHEMFECQALQGLVKRQFHYALKECERRMHKSRFRWQLPGGHLVVYMPDHIIGRERAKWLENHVPDPNPRVPMEVRRIQQIIDEVFFNGVEYEDETKGEKRGDRDLLESVCYVPGEDIAEFELNQLAQVVATEKRIQIHRQRKAIQVLGAERLQQLIERIFEDVASGDYVLSDIARHFGISLPTFTRFAGAFWNHPMKQVPDLWENTAMVLTSHPLFQEILKNLDLAGSGHSWASGFDKGVNS